MVKRVLTLVVEFPVGEYPEWIKKAHFEGTDGLRVTDIQEGNTVELYEEIMAAVDNSADELPESFIDTLDTVEVNHFKKAIWG